MIKGMFVAGWDVDDRPAYTAAGGKIHFVPFEDAWCIKTTSEDFGYLFEVISLFGRRDTVAELAHEAGYALGLPIQPVEILMQRSYITGTGLTVERVVEHGGWEIRRDPFSRQIPPALYRESLARVSSSRWPSMETALWALLKATCPPVDNDPTFAW